MHTKIVLVYRGNVSTAQAATATETEKSSTVELRGDVLEVLQALLAEGHSSEVVALLMKLVSRNSELEKRLAQLLSGGRKNDGVSSAQLKLFLESLEKLSDEAAGGPEGKAADQKLRDSSGVDQKEGKQTKPPKQPSLRKPAPPHLRHIENLILVPAGERGCPKCGKERDCIGHEVTEVIELIPAEVVVRVDKKEKLACRPCDGELVRASSGDKVVSGGKLGPGLVAELLVDKYDDGLPLHRQKRRFERMGLVLPVSTLADQVTGSTDLLRPIWRAAVQAVLAAEIMHLDGTGLPVLDRSAVGGKHLSRPCAESHQKTSSLDPSWVASITSTTREWRETGDTPSPSISCTRTCVRVWMAGDSEQAPRYPNLRAHLFHFSSRSSHCLLSFGELPSPGDFSYP